MRSALSARITPTLIALTLYVLVQIVYVLFSAMPFISDSVTHIAFAQAALQEGTYYPNPSSLYADWLVAPVYINCLILLLKSGLGVKLLLLFNVLLNTLQLVLVYKITKKIFSERAALVSGVIYILYLNNLGLVLLNLTELSFGVLILTSVYFFISSPSYGKGLLCGLAVSLAIGIRPTGWALVIAFIIISIIHIIQGRAYYLKSVGIMCGIMLYIIPMAILSQRNIGRFEFASTTGPANLIMSANPKARGVFDPQFFHTDSVYLTKKTYPEKNEYLLAQSKEYIRRYPGKWLGLIPRKFYSTFISDVWAVPPLLHTHTIEINGYLKNKEGVRKALGAKPFLFRIAFWILNLWQQLIYTLIFLFFCYQLFNFLRRKNFKFEVLLINLFIAGGIALSILASVGNPRYKYNFLIAGIIVLSPYVLTCMDRLLLLRTNKVL